MNTLFARSISLLLALSFAVPAFGKWNKIDWTEYEMADPPAVGSAAYKKDFEELHRFQKEREKADCELAGKQTFPSVKVFFAPVLTKKEFEKTEELVEKVMEYTEKVSAKFKGEYMRPRPYSVDSTLKPCATKPTGSRSYPSSHASMAAAGACVLAAIYPEKATELKEHGKFLGDLRVIVGVHHPSDVKAGQTLAKDICDRLLSEEDFQEELEGL